MAMIGICAPVNSSFARIAAVVSKTIQLRHLNVHQHEVN